MVSTLKRTSAIVVRGFFVRNFVMPDVTSGGSAFSGGRF